MSVSRCDWAQANPLEQNYHDTEWGVPEHDDTKLFELLTLEGMQAGLSWSTILRKRDTISEAFDHFAYDKIACYSEDKIAELLVNPGIVHNKLKTNAAVTNAQAFIRIREEFGSFDSYLWDFVGGVPLRGNWNNTGEVPASTDLSDKISADLRRRGFKFVGTTSVYAFLQACGVVNDHIVSCFRFGEV